MADFETTFEDGSGFEMTFGDSNGINANVMDNITLNNITMHNDLDGRSASNAHPISSISGLDEKLQEVPSESITAEEIMELF
jgi:hypothetical protein